METEIKLTPEETKILVGTIIPAICLLLYFLGKASLDKEKPD